LRLSDHDWPGNIRELENLMRRLAVLVRDDVIGPEIIDQQLVGRPARAETQIAIARTGLAQAVEAHLSGYFAEFGTNLPPDGLYDRILEDMERPLLMATMAAVRGNQLRAARLLGINRNTLRKKLNDLAIDPAVGRR
jgi:two-component system nitrogen regulation response regulator GlnG